MLSFLQGNRVGLSIKIEFLLIYLSMVPFLFIATPQHLLFSLFSHSPHTQQQIARSRCPIQHPGALIHSRVLILLIRTGNEYWETLCCIHSSLVSFLPALEFSDRLVKDPQLASDWLTKLASSVNQISSFYHTIVTSVFLYQGSTPQSVQQATKVC